MDWREWSNRSVNGEVCGILGCEEKPTSKCPLCNHFYCYDHISVHLHASKEIVIDEDER